MAAIRASGLITAVYASAMALKRRIALAVRQVPSLTCSSQEPLGMSLSSPLISAADIGGVISTAGHRQFRVGNIPRNKVDRADRRAANLLSAVTAIARTSSIALCQSNADRHSPLPRSGRITTITQRYLPWAQYGVRGSVCGINTAVRGVRFPVDAPARHGGDIFAVRTNDHQSAAL